MTLVPRVSRVLPVLAELTVLLVPLDHRGQRELQVPPGLRVLRV